MDEEKEVCIDKKVLEEMLEKTEGEDKEIIYDVLEVGEHTDNGRVCLKQEDVKTILDKIDKIQGSQE